MWRLHWPTDTIARWFTINILCAIAGCVLLNAVFIQVAGVWAKPQFGSISLLEQVASTMQIIAAAPASLRSKLAAAANNSLYDVSWHPKDGPAMPPTGPGEDILTAELRRIIGRPQARVSTYDPYDLSNKETHSLDYSLAVDLPDGSWLNFATTHRTWGLESSYRYLLIAFFILSSSLIVSSFASKRLARPIEHFSRAAERFGADVHAPAMDLSGPLEYRRAIGVFNDMQTKIQKFVIDRTEMLSAISHDLRAPLTRMRLLIEFIENTEQQQRLFRDVDEMQAMVNSALSFFREDSFDEDMTRFDISELVNTVVDDFRDIWKEVSFEGKPHAVYFGRPHALRRAIYNLVDNAIKYGKSASVFLTTSNSGIEITVDDRGQGIPDELMETVFRPFFRIEPSRNRETGGVGIGLSAARSIVRGHGGDIVLNNRKPSGLSVTLTLPLNRTLLASQKS